MGHEASGCRAAAKGVIGGADASDGGDDVSDDCTDVTQTPEGVERLRRQLLLTRAGSSSFRGSPVSFEEAYAAALADGWYLVPINDPADRARLGGAESMLWPPPPAVRQEQRALGRRAPPGLPAAAVWHAETLPDGARMLGHAETLPEGARLLVPPTFYRFYFCRPPP